MAAVCLAAAYGTGQAQTGTTSAQAQRRLSAERHAEQRAAITAGANGSAEKACCQRFAVEDRPQAARAKPAAELAPSAGAELELNQQERQERAAQRLQAIEAKQAQTVPPCTVQSHTRKPAPDAASAAAKRGPRRRGCRPGGPEERQRQADHAQRVQAQEAHAGPAPQSGRARLAETSSAGPKSTAPKPSRPSPGWPAAAGAAAGGQSPRK